MRSRRFVSVALFLAAVVWFSLDTPSAQGPPITPASLGAVDVAYQQSFDTMASSGTSNVLPAGWGFDETGTSARNDGNYTAGTGSDNAGDVYAFGASGSPDRALGQLRSGTLVPVLGA